MADLFGGSDDDLDPDFLVGEDVAGSEKENYTSSSAFSEADTDVKWTPLTNQILIGHDAIEGQLVTLFNENKLPHALIFFGPHGVGKATMAYRLARTLLVRGAMSEDTGPSLFGDPAPAAIKLQNLSVPLDDPAATRMAAGANPDFLSVGGDNSVDNKSGNILVDDVRKVPNFLRLKPSVDGGWRVVLIDNADTMNRNAQNALLKILEEPPPRTLLILVAHQIGTLLPTIRSRAREIPFTRLSDTDFKAALSHLGYRLNTYDLAWVEALSQGCPGDVSSILDVDGLALIRTFLNLWDEWPKYDEPAWLSFTEEMAAQGADDPFRFILQFWLWWARALLKAKADPVRLAPLTELLADHGGALRPLDHYNLAQLIEICDKLDEHFARALSASLERRQVLYSARLMMTQGIAV